MEGGLMESISVVDAVRAAWARVGGTQILPGEFKLLEVTEKHETLELLVTGPAGESFGYRTPLHDPERSFEQAPDEWVMWNVIVPLVEELETDPASRYPADENEIRWIDSD